MPYEFPIHLTIAGEPVEGVGIVPSLDKLVVKITRPYQDLLIRKQLTFFSRLPDNQRFGENAITHQIAQQALQQIYLNANKAVQNVTLAKNALPFLDTPESKLEDFPNDKASLRRKFKEGKISQRKYQNCLNERNDAREIVRSEIRKLKDRLISKIFGEENGFIPPEGWHVFLNEQIKIHEANLEN